jgi:PAS domain-containing protein
VLLRKLEAKRLRLEQANRSLEGEIRERRLVEGNLRISEAGYRDMFANAVEGIYQSTSEDRFISVNLSFARIYGCDSPRDMMEGVPSIARQVYLSPDDKRRLNAEFQARGFIRPYRPALAVEAALEEFMNYRGTQFDEDVVDLYVRLFRERGYDLQA